MCEQSNSDVALVIASDGVWDELSNNDVRKCVIGILFLSLATQGPHLRALLGV
jgi:serine/threonine protein phosphatase PrpC